LPRREVERERKQGLIKLLHLLVDMLLMLLMVEHHSFSKAAAEAEEVYCSANER
jgi:hypothetical protein